MDNIEEIPIKDMPPPETKKEPEKKVGKKENAISIIWKKIPLKYIIIACCALIVLLSLTFVRFWYSYQEKKYVKVVKSAIATDQQEPAPKIEASYTIELPQFVVTIVNDVNNANQLVSFKIKIALELKNESVKKELEEKMAQIRDSIINVLSTKKVSELNNTAGKLKLKDETKKYVNSFLENNDVLDIHFTEFLYQN